MRRFWFLSLLIAVGVLSSLRAPVSGQVSRGAAPVPAGYLAYSNPDLHLTWLYPAELTPMDGAFAASAARRMIYGEETETDQARADNCAKVLLSVGKGSEGKGGWSRVGLVRIDGRCFPPKVLQKRKDTQMLLRNLVRQGTTVMGMSPLEEPAGYQIEGHWASFGAAQGQPISNSDVQTAEQQLVGMAAVQAQGGIVGWVIETNDAAMFNRLLGSGVDFETGTAQRLFGGGVQ